MSKDFYGQFRDYRLNLTHRDEFRKLSEKLNEQFVKVKIEPVALEPKTPKQLGYYWAVLLPAIHEELVKQGWTITISGKLKNQTEPITRQREINQQEAHDTIKDLCALIGDNGSRITLSKMDKLQCQMFIDNVLNFAGELNMQVENLMTWRDI